MVWYGMIWYGMIWYGTQLLLSFPDCVDGTQRVGGGGKINKTLSLGISSSFLPPFPRSLY